MLLFLLSLLMMPKGACISYPRWGLQYWQ
jgi:hypothetical protein